MNRIYKYQLCQPGFNVLVNLPVDAKVVDFQEQHGEMFIWAMVGQHTNTEPRTFLVVGTGWDIPYDFEYVKTCHSRGFVWHLLEKKDFY